MSVSVTRDDVVAQISMALTREHLQDQNPDFPRAAHMTYSILTDLIRKAHEHAYPDRAQQYRGDAEEYPLEQFSPSNSPFNTPNNTEGLGHLYNATGLYLDNVLGQTNLFDDEPLIQHLNKMQDTLLNRIIEAKLNSPTQTMSHYLPEGDAYARGRIRDEISALNATGPLLFDMESGLRSVTARLLIENRDRNILFTGPEVLRGILLQGGRELSENAPLIVPRTFPHSDTSLDPAFKALFAQVAENGDRNAISESDLPQALTRMAAITEAMLTKLSDLPVEAFRGLDGKPYRQDELDNLLDGLKSTAVKFKVAATLPDRRFEGELPFNEAKAKYQQQFVADQTVYIFSRDAQRMPQEGDDRNAYVQTVRSYLQDNPVTATTEKPALDALLQRYGGTSIGLKFSPEEINQLGPVFRGPKHAFAETTIAQFMYDLDVKALKENPDFAGALEKIGIPSTPGLEYAMSEGLKRVDGYELQDPFTASKALTDYTCSRLVPDARMAWEEKLNERELTLSAKPT